MTFQKLQQVLMLFMSVLRTQRQATALRLKLMTVLLTHEAATVSIAITAVNDEPTKVNLSSLTIDENAAATEIGTLSTDDLDTNDTFTYELVSGEGDTDNSLFTIETDKLKNTDAFDFETKSSYSIRIKSTDSGSASVEGVFAITVNNINDIAISSEITSTYCDGSDGIGSITIVTSETNGEVTYTWTGPNGFSSTESESNRIGIRYLRTNCKRRFV